MRETEAPEDPSSEFDLSDPDQAATAQLIAVCRKQWPPRRALTYLVFAVGWAALASPDPNEQLEWAIDALQQLRDRPKK